MTTKATPTQSKKSGTKKVSTERQTKSVTTESESSLSESSVTVDSVEETPVQDEIPELPPLTEEEITAQKELLERGIERGMEWFEFGQDAESFESMTVKEKSLTRLLDPMVWMMREALISYQERSEGCEECTKRVEERGNGIQLAIAELLLADD